LELLIQDVNSTILICKAGYGEIMMRFPAMELMKEIMDL